MSSIEWTTKFSTVVACDTDLLPNTYKMKVGLLPLVPDVYSQNVGFERVKFFLNSVCNNSCIINIGNPNYPKLKKIMDSTQFMTTPDEPFDQLLIIILYHKINHILEGNFDCDYLTLESYQGEDVQYSFDSEYTSTFIDEKEYFPKALRDKRLPWWLRKDPGVSDTFSKIEEEPVFNWEDIGLSFDNPHEEKAGEVIDISGHHTRARKPFTPHIIEGTKKNLDIDS